MEIISESVNDTIKTGRLIAKNLKRADIVCLFGELGSGKTVLSKGIASALGIARARINSPSFVLIREHLRGKLPFYHLDLYRLNGPAQILALGYEEYLYGEGITVIEWADRLGYLMPKECLKINLEVKGQDKRKIKIIPLGRRYEEAVEMLKEAYRA